MNETRAWQLDVLTTRFSYGLATIVKKKCSPIKSIQLRAIQIKFLLDFFHLNLRQYYFFSSLVIEGALVIYAAMVIDKATSLSSYLKNQRNDGTGERDGMGEGVAFMENIFSRFTYGHGNKILFSGEFTGYVKTHTDGLNDPQIYSLS